MDPSYMISPKLTGGSDYQPLPEEKTSNTISQAQHGQTISTIQKSHGSNRTKKNILSLRPSSKGDRNKDQSKNLNIEDHEHRHRGKNHGNVIAAMGTEEDTDDGNTHRMEARNI